MRERCCPDPSCKRKTPILLRRGALDERWWVLTRYTRKGDTVRSIERHMLDEETQAGLDEAFAALDAVKRVRELCEPERWEAHDARRSTLPVHEILAALDGTGEATDE